MSGRDLSITHSAQSRHIRLLWFNPYTQAVDDLLTSTEGAAELCESYYESIICAPFFPPWKTEGGACHHLSEGFISPWSVLEAMKTGLWRLGGRIKTLTFTAHKHHFLSAVSFFVAGFSLAFLWWMSECFSLFLRSEIVWGPVQWNYVKGASCLQMQMHASRRTHECESGVFQLKGLVGRDMRQEVKWLVEN